MGFLSRIANSGEDVERNGSIPIAFAREHKKCRRSAIHSHMWPFVKEHSSEDTLPKTCSDPHLLSQYSECKNSSTGLVTRPPPSDVGIKDMATQTVAENASLKTKWNLSTPALNFASERVFGKQNLSNALCIAEEEGECTDESSANKDTVICFPEQEENESFHETCLHVSTVSTDTHTTLLSTTVPALQQNPLAEDHSVEVSYVIKVDCDKSGTIHTSVVPVESNDKQNSYDYMDDSDDDLPSSGNSNNAYWIQRQLRRDRNAAKAKGFWRIMTYAFTIYGGCLLVLAAVFLLLASGENPTIPPENNKSFYFGQ